MGMSARRRKYARELYRLCANRARGANNEFTGKDLAPQPVRVLSFAAEFAIRRDDLVGAPCRTVAVAARSYRDALAELSAEINRQHARVSIDSGCFLAFNNFRGVHKHALASEGYCLYYKTYARHSLRALQVQGESGPIFSLSEAGASRQGPADLQHPQAAKGEPDYA